MALNWQQITEDYQQKYGRTWCWATINGKEQELFYVDNVEDTGREPYIHLRNEKQGEVILRYDTENELNFSFPEQGVHQLDKYAVVFFRTYLRQFQKGLCKQTAKIVIPYADFIHWPEQMWDEKNISKLFKRSSPVFYKEALNLLEKDYLSVRLDNHFSLGLNVTDKNLYLLWYLDVPVGYVDNAGKVNMIETQFDQEWRDYLKRFTYGYYL